MHSPTTATSACAIEIRNLTKTYPGGVEAVKGLTFDVAHGEVFGLLGPNGAGKSTTVGMLTTTIAPTAGRAWLAGFDVATDPVAARRASAVVFQEPGALVDRAVDTYSGGQRRRLEIARRETRDRHGGATDHRSARP
jgi:ABC-2 type transport system ATP-binding protein